MPNQIALGAGAQQPNTGLYVFGEWLTPGTYNVTLPAGTSTIYVDGAGGGGGGGAGYASATSGAGGGGGASACSARMHPVRIPPTTTRIRITIGAGGAGGVVGGAAAGAGGDTIIIDPDAPTGAYSQVLLTLWGVSGTVAQPGGVSVGGNGGGMGPPLYQNGGAGGAASTGGAAGGATIVSKSGTYFCGTSGSGGGGSAAVGGQTLPINDNQPYSIPGYANGNLGGGGAGGMTIVSESWPGRRGYHGLTGGTGIPYGNDCPGSGGAGGGCNVSGNPGGNGYVRIYL